jgi:cytochrome P450
MGRERVVGIADPTLADRVLRARPQRFRRLATVEPIFKELGVDGVFSAEGNAWRPQRKLAMGPLSHRHQAEYYPTLRLAGERLLARLARVASEEGEVDLQGELMRFTVDVTVKLVFGYDMNTLEEGEDVIQKKLALIFPKLNRRLFSLVPWWRLFRTPSDRRLDRALSEIRTWVSGLLDEARAQLAADPARHESPPNFLEAMLAARDAEGRPYSDELLFGNALTMLLAGEDTTAHSVAWAVHELCDHPEAVEGLRAEADEVFGSGAVPGSIEAIARLHYAMGVANETMRLRPIAPALIFQANEDTAIADIDIPKGTSVMVLTRLPALSAEHFERPESFVPERWLSAHEHQGAHDAKAHIPFGSGPRICPGRSLAMLEMRLLLASIYKAFDIERVGARESVREHFSFVMTARGLRVRLRPRARA